MPPSMLINALEAVRRRARRLNLAYGVGIVLSAGAGLLLATVLSDYLLNLPPAPRLVMMSAAAVVLAYAAFRWIIQPGIARLTLSDIAGRLERAFPQFDDRLRSTLDFLHPEAPGSDVMKQRVVEQATALASTINLNSAVIAKPAWYSLGGAAASLLFVSLLAALAGSQFRSIALKHLLMPFADRPWPKRVQISADGTLPTRVPVGQRLDVRMTLVRGDKPSMKPVVCYQYDNGPIQQEFMARGEDGVYAASLDARVDASRLTGNLHVWMKAGDDRLDLPAVTVVPRLAVKSVEAIVTPPKYVTNGPPTTINLSAAPAVMAVGSEVALRVTFNKPLAGNSAVTIEPLASASPSTQPVMTANATWSSDGEMTTIGRFTAVNPLRFHLHAVDTDGFSNNALEEYELIVRPDQTPSVQIENPRRNEERTEVATVPLQGLAEDDYGINTLKLVVDRIERASDSKAPHEIAAAAVPSHWEIPLVDNGAAVKSTDADSVGWTHIEGTGDRQRFRVNYAWDLSQLKDAALNGGDILEYYLLVTDNFNLNGQTHAPVPSGKLRISIISQDDLTNRVIADLQAAKTQVEDAKRVQSRNQQETANLAEDTKSKRALDEADRVAGERLTGEQSAVAGQTRQIAAKVEEIGQRLDENKSPQQDLKDMTRDVAGDLNDAAERPMKLAAQNLTQAQQPKPAEARNADLDQAKSQQAEANDDLQRAMDRMGDIGSLQQMIARINDLLRQQKDVGDQTQEAGKNNLGKRPEEMTPEDRQKLEAAADAQSKLADRTAKALDAMKKAADQLAKTDPAAAEAMAKAAETAQQQQVTPSQQKAAQQAKQNQQASAQSSQKQAELGLQMIVADLEQAEQRKLAQLSKQLEEMQQQIANLIRRQAGHNLDNVTVQGADALAKLDPAVATDLNQLAERTVDGAGQLPASPPEPDRLAPSQEQTERNTRDISKSAESLPNGATPAAQLLRAAGHMERAAVSLADSKWTDAYNPPQVEALASLQAAKKTVDEQKAKVDAQIAAQQKEAIRQKYVEIKQDQEKLDSETVRVDSARDPQGELKRADMIRLGQLPGEQGKLSDRVAELDQVLLSAGSIVYVWANKDIVHSMMDVKTDLPVPEKVVSTQAEQVRIVDQLDAMIRNLATKPKESKFAAEGGSGNCKPGSPPMPSEAELRLMKDLQQAVNKNTKVADAQPVKDKPQLLALGTREGELRGLLDQLLKKSSGGLLKLGPEPDASKQLPEEAKAEDVENDELDKNLLTDKPAAEQEETQAGLIGDRMGRSRQRLAINTDPGKVTQIIQDRILKDFDVLIDQARQQQAELRNPPKDAQPPQKQSKPGEQLAKADNQGKKPGSPKPNPKSNPAQVSAANAPGSAATDLSKEIKESLAEWGQVTPRLRDAQIEGSSETIIEQYRKLTEDYYRSLAAKATER